MHCDCRLLYNVHETKTFGVRDTHLSKHTRLSLQSSKHSLRWCSCLSLSSLENQEKCQILRFSEAGSPFLYFFPSGHHWLCCAFSCSSFWSRQGGQMTKECMPRHFQLVYDMHEFAGMARVCIHHQSFISILALYLPIFPNTHNMRGNDIAIANYILCRG